MNMISANELKTKGVASIESALAKSAEAIISVRGQERYVVMNLDEYNRLRVCELESALYETRQQIAADSRRSRPSAPPRNPPAGRRGRSEGRIPRDR